MILSLLNPNLVYLFIVGGMSLAFMAILMPGTGLLEIVALCALILAGWGMFHLPINYWALILLIVGVFPPLWLTLKTQKRIYLFIATCALVIGSAFLINGGRWYALAIDPILAFITSLFVGGFFWIVTEKSFESVEIPPAHDLHTLIGATGEAKSNIQEAGTVQVHGELWSARSDKPILAGSRIRVVDRDGFVLIVEKV